MKVMSPTLVTVTVPPRKGVENAPGALTGAACTTDNFQNGLLVCGTRAMALVLLVKVKVNGRPLAEEAVTGTINDFPATMVAAGMGSITGAAARGSAAAKSSQATRRLRGMWLFASPIVFGDARVTQN